MVSLSRSGWLKLRILLSQPLVLQSHLVSFLSPPVALPTAPVLSSALGSMALVSVLVETAPGMCSMPL